MAAGTTGSRSKGNKSASRTSGTRSNSKKTSSTKKSKAEETIDGAIVYDIMMIGLFAVAVILFLCNFGVIGPAGNAISSVMFGLFGGLAYVAPILLFLGIAFGTINQGNFIAKRKLIAGIILFLLAGVIFELASGVLNKESTYDLAQLYTRCADKRSGGGVFAGSMAFVLYHFLAMAGTVLVIIVAGIICLVVITDKSFVDSVVNGGHKMMELSRDDAGRRREQAMARREEMNRRRERNAEQKRLREEEKENEKILRMDKKVSGVMLDTSLKASHEESGRDDIHEIVLDGMEETGSGTMGQPETFVYDPEPDFEKIHIHTAHSAHTDEERGGTDSGQTDGHETNGWDGYQEFSYGNGYGDPDDYGYSAPYGYGSEGNVETLTGTRANWRLEPETEHGFRTEHSYMTGSEKGFGPESSHMEETENDFGPESSYMEERENGFGSENPYMTEAENGKEPLAEPGVRTRPTAKPAPKTGSQIPAGMERSAGPQMSAGMEIPQKKLPKKYVFPSVSLLKKGDAKGGDSEKLLKETAARLQQTLSTFGVRVTITEISQGPSVTRYELQPEQGVKVSKIVGLADDIKLNLAATDIRIEAPIPGKAAVGIEVPNKENSPVALRELLESKEFKEFDSPITFAVGKDIAGKTVVADIAKMPHMLIAGATGSGKSVCINTLIMSILYKAHPDDVKLIMVDPKVVELSVYNGIPHLMIPVVTDPKKAAAALQWGVAEMTERYKKFADFNVRDLKGYNKKVESMKEADAPAKMPQIIIIVDELADLMMVAAGEVEEAICRLAQLARAAGIHLIIATQRPSVDVITGLIKANMPSRVAFAVSSGVDSRTILDMNGAEKLLGKGDMLFYPQGYPKPARVQGAFVSDKEVSDVVEFLKNQVLGNTYNEDIEEKIQTIGSASGGAAGGSAGDRDAYFEEAARFIIDKDKASIGMLQRVFKIGFNRAARIMDQLCDAGIVGEEEGTKPRKVLMSMEQFEQYLEEY